MTVCVAALCGNRTRIFGAADRTITRGDTEYELAQPKIYAVSNAIALMTAGNTSVHGELLSRVGKLVAERIALDRSRWWLVRDVADLCAQTYAEIRNEDAARTVLSRLSLDWEKLNDPNAGGPAISTALENLSSHNFDSVETIVAGRDPTGAHIYTVYDDYVQNNDIVAYSAIGSGATHASTFMMFAGHHAGMDSDVTLLNVYSAKRKSEVAAGVGEATDMFMVGDSLPALYEIPPAHIARFDTDYQRIERDIAKEKSKGTAQFKRTLAKLAQAMTQAAKKQQEVRKDPTLGRAKG